MLRNLRLHCLLLLVVFLQSSHAFAMNVRVSPGDETIQIEVSGSGATPESAREDAIRKAVMQAVGSFIRSDVAVEDEALVRDRVISHTQGLIEQYEPLAPASKKDGLFEERARVTVRRTKLAGILTDLAKADGTIDGVTLAARLDELRRQRASAAELVELVFENWPANVLSVSIGALPTHSVAPPNSSVGHDIVVGDDDVYLEAKIDLRVDPIKWKTWAASAREVFKGIAVANVSTGWNAESDAERLAPDAAEGPSREFAQTWGHRLSPEAGSGKFLRLDDRSLSDEEVATLLGAIQQATASTASRESKPSFGRTPASNPVPSSVLIGISEHFGGEPAFYLVPCSALSRLHSQAPIVFPPLLEASLVANDGTDIPARPENVTQIWSLRNLIAAQHSESEPMWASPALCFTGGVYVGGEPIRLRVLCFTPWLQASERGGAILAEAISIPVGFVVERGHVDKLGSLKVEVGRRYKLSDDDGLSVDLRIPSFDSRGPRYDFEDCR
jgi:hypothetical protein